MRKRASTGCLRFWESVVGLVLCLAVVSLLITGDSTPSHATSLTVSTPLQQVIRPILADGLHRTHAQRGMAVVMNAQTGAIESLVTDGASDNLAIKAWEPGSIVKPLMMAAALNEGVVDESTTYYDPGHESIHDRVIINAVNRAPQVTSMQDIITLSLNTGAVHLLKSLGDGQLNYQARSTWYRYLTQYYRFGKPTGVVANGESTGYVRPPSGGQDIEFRYAGSSFGVGFTATPLQMMSAYASVLNGGTYYRPQFTDGRAKNPVVLPSLSVAPHVGRIIQRMMQEQLAHNNKVAVRDGYFLGGKSGTAPVADDSGSYKAGVDNGSYIGFIGKDHVQYIVFVRLDEPKTNGFASSEAAKTWASVSNHIIDEGLLGLD